MIVRVGATYVAGRQLLEQASANRLTAAARQNKCSGTYRAVLKLVRLPDDLLQSAVLPYGPEM
jgi:hypothetical protein